MVYRVLLVGCGNVGSRHLQALVKVPFPLNIDIIEPNPSSKKLGLLRLEEISYNKKTKIISWYNHYTSEIINSDLVIISTLAKNRVNLLIKLIKNGHKRILCEKYVCQSKNLKHTQNVLGMAAGVTEVTIRNRINDIKKETLNDMK